MLESLSSLVALQALDTAADAARKKINEVPAAERALDAAIASAQAAVDDAKAKVSENGAARRVLEKEVATIDARMAKFEDHKAAVKTNQEFTALNHEIEVAQTSKSALEDQIITLMDEADTLNAALKAAEAALADQKKSRKPRLRASQRSGRPHRRRFPRRCSPNTTRSPRTARASPSPRWWRDIARRATSGCALTSNNRCAGTTRS